MPHRLLVPLLLCMVCPFANAAENESDPKPVVLDFDDATFKTIGKVAKIAGPRSPEFPKFSSSNRGVKFQGDGGRIILAKDREDDLRFDNGDAITIEAWIAPRTANGSGPRYVIGKGRTGNRGFRRDNQNWGLRVTPSGEGFRLSFLFATASGDKSVDWHRWETKETVRANDGWHHVAVSYQFGTPESVRAWIDGERCSGVWDMAGPTDVTPISDDDEIWIGSAQGGSSGNSFVGSIDSVSISRRLAVDEEIASRYVRDDSIPRVVLSTKPKMPELGTLPEGVVSLTLHEQISENSVWMEAYDNPPEFAWTGDSFLITRLPLHFDDWGIRSAWKGPVLLTVAADVEIPSGKIDILARARSLSRLWIDGKLVLSTKLQNKRGPSGEEPVTPIAEPPREGMRVKAYRQHEVIAPFEIVSDEATKRCRVVYQILAGGSNVRTETGETCVAFASENDTVFQTLLPIGGRVERLPLVDSFVAPEIIRIETELKELERDTRRRLAGTQDVFWQSRHEFARRWVKENQGPQPPRTNDQSEHPIDAFILHRIDEVQQEFAQSATPEETESERRFSESVLPILKTHCFRCHDKTAKGGLRLDSREAALAGGDSGWEAVVPGKADESELILRLQTDDPSTRMPPNGDRPGKHEITEIVRWIRSGAPWKRERISKSQLTPTQPVDDASFLRRASLDTVGLPPTRTEVEQFLNDDSANKRERLVNRLLDDERIADHLVSDWMDLFAENPTLLNKSLNSTGPFRWFLHDALTDGKSFDRIVTELIMMRGDAHTGGSAGFGLAGENDVPMAAKAHILASGLLGIEMQCARCHDSPYHSTTQEDLFSIAAMLNRKPIAVPATSRVPAAFFEKQQRESLIEVTLAPNQSVKPRWSLQRFVGIDNDESLDPMLQNPSDSRERLAMLITSPANERFSRVVVNRIWTRLIGRGLVESLNDWEHTTASHPELLDWLGNQFVVSGYDLRHVMRLIMTSDLYGRQALDASEVVGAGQPLFAAPVHRRLTAEQIVDSMFFATGATMDSEELTFVHDGRRTLSSRLTLGKPSRAWMFATLNNERDRPSLSLPRARVIVDVLQAFGWNGSRQKPLHDRPGEPNVLQPGILANGTLTATLSRAAVNSRLAQIAVQSKSVDEVIDVLFLRFLSRFPTEEEHAYFQGQLADGFDHRLVAKEQQSTPEMLPELPLVHWFNHLRPKANEIQVEHERRVREGPPSDPRLEPAWRERYEDVVWALINHDEFVWMP